MTPHERATGAQGKIIIAGTGRAGTTFLVQLFTALRFQTGFSIEQSRQCVDQISHAGLESALDGEAIPHVIKSPWFADQLEDALRERRIDISAALLPVRDLFSAAESRRRVYQSAASFGLDPLTHPGSLWHTDDPDRQEEILTRQLYKTIVPLVEYEIPIYLVVFPRLIHDPIYLFRTLKPLLERYTVAYEEFLQAHEDTARPELIHDFTSPGKKRPL